MWANIQAVCFIVIFVGRSQGAEYLGKFIGKLTELHHGVSGEVYAVDGRTLHIKDFSYDGQAPAAYWYANVNNVADKNGFKIRDDAQDGIISRRYRKESVTLTLPEGKTLRDIKILYVWCEEFDVSFGDVKIPRGFEFPRPQKIDALQGVHDVSSDNIVIVDAQTLLVPNFRYDGEAPDAKFWVGRGSRPSPQGIRVPNENGKEQPLAKYDGKTVVLTLPGDLTVFDIGHFGIWCEQFTVDFGHVQIPQGLNVPPSLKMLGVKPQSHSFYRQPLVVNSREENRLPTARNMALQRGHLVGGHLQPTTFRPPSVKFGLQRQNQEQQGLVRQQSIFGQHSTFGLSSQYQPSSGTQQIPFIQHQIQEGFIQDRAQERKDFGYQPFNQYQPVLVPSQGVFQNQHYFHKPEDSHQLYPSFTQNYQQQQFNQQRSLEINNQPLYQNQPQQRSVHTHNLQLSHGYQPLNQYQNNQQLLGQNQHRFDLGNQHSYVPFG